ncbi:type II secretion system protein N [Ideonella sp. BN130291]|uniref:type II secretion system protein N n=1 Tax=Ideonella sp. BN130291 TaxID=3112940 RepID=UPI002E26F89E|nr:type II secretion system protein N [Ideonella sp. BN130291]
MRSFRDTLNWLPKRRKRFARTGFAESTLAELAWQRTRSAASRWGGWGVLAGVLYGLVAFAPAGWLARSVASATDSRLLLTEARGTVWNGSAVLVLTGGPGSRDASALPGRFAWDLGLRGAGLELKLRQACCLNGEVAVRIRPGFGRMQIELVPPGTAQAGGAVAQWPAAWLAGLGTPWNTLQLGGVLKLATPGFTLESAQGRWHMSGQADLLLLGASSRLSTLDTLGSYRLSLVGAASPSAATQINLSTLDGGLQLNGAGQWTAGKVRFRGDARAAPGSEAALNNLLNIIGRRQGALSLISIG